MIYLRKRSFDEILWQLIKGCMEMTFMPSLQPSKSNEIIPLTTHFYEGILSILLFCLLNSEQRRYHKSGYSYDLKT